MEINDEFVGYGFGHVRTLGRFEANMNINGVITKVPINVVSNEMQEIPLLVGHPFTEQRHVMITIYDYYSAAGGLSVEQVIPNTEVTGTT